MQAETRQLKRRVKLRDLDTLMTVVSAGGMRKAADQLHLSQPAVSKAVAELEDALGITLLDRSRQGVAITPAGRALIKRAAVMFDELQQGVRELEHLADPYAGEISLACAETINAGLVATAMERMTRQYPRVSFGVDSGDPPVLLSRFLLERVSDFVISRPHGAVIDTDIRAEPLFREKLQVVVGRTSPWANRRKLMLAELAGEPWILSRSEVTGDSPVVEAFRKAGRPLPSCKVLTGSLNVRYTLLATGRFVTVMPHSLLRFGAGRSSLKVLPIEIGQWTMPTMLLTLANRSLSPAAKTFLDIVRELCRPLDE
jgi:DNA-binding transcriptional LysR family regulator